MNFTKVSGFSEKSGKKQKDVEKQFDKMINTQNIDDWVKYMSAEPHHVGSSYTDKVIA